MQKFGKFFMERCLSSFNGRPSKPVLRVVEIKIASRDYNQKKINYILRWEKAKKCTGTDAE